MRSAAMPRFSSKIPGFISDVIPSQIAGLCCPKYLCQFAAGRRSRYTPLYSDRPLVAE